MAFRFDPLLNKVVEVGKNALTGVSTALDAIPPSVDIYPGPVDNLIFGGLALANKGIKKLNKIDDVARGAVQRYKFDPLTNKVVPDKTVNPLFKAQPNPLLEEAKKYKSAEEFMSSQSLYHGTPYEIEGNKLKFGAGKQPKKGGYMGGHFLTNEPDIAQTFSFGGKVYQASGEIKNQVIDVNKDIDIFKKFVGKKYPNVDGEMVEFTKQEFDFMFPEGKADWSTVNTDLAEYLAKKKGKIGIAVPEFAGGKEGTTYQIFKDEIPIHTKDELTDIWEKANVGSQVDPLITEARKYNNVEDFIESQRDFRDAHAAPSFDNTPVKQRMETGGDYNLSEVVKGQHNQPSDYFDPRLGPRYYMYDDQAGMESLTAINNVKRGAKSITAYRVVPNDVKADKLIDRDWISFSKKYALDHGESRFGEGSYKIIEQEVSPKNVWWDGNDIREWGYDTGKTIKLNRQELTDIWNKAVNKK